MPSIDRARGALYGLAIGDALGMPTQMLSRRQAVDRWGPLLTGFEPAPPDHAIAVIDSHGFGLEELADSLCALR